MNLTEKIINGTINIMNDVIKINMKINKPSKIELRVQKSDVQHVYQFHSI